MFKCFVVFCVILCLTSFSFAEIPLIERMANGDFDAETSCPPGSPWMTDQVSWTQVADTPIIFYRAACGVLGNYFYCFGTSGITCPANAYNLITEQWEPSTPPPTGVGNWNGVTTNDALYLIGWYGDGGYGNQIQKFVPTGGSPTGTWTSMANYPMARCGIAAAWDGGNFIYAAGGNPASADANKYDIANNRWIPIASMTYSESYAGGAFVNGKFYVIGGTSSPTLNREYDPAADTWTFKTPAPSPLYFPMFNTTNNDHYIFVIGGGGYNTTWPSSNLVHTYNPATDTWFAETPLPLEIGMNSACWVGRGVVMSAGGRNMSIVVNWTFKGENFPSTGAGHDLEITLTPNFPPIRIPAGGGMFSFDAQVENITAAPLVFDSWTDITCPNGAIVGPLILRTNITVGANASILRTGIVQYMPRTAPAGQYTYNGYAGIYPGTIFDDDSFPVIKQPGDAAPECNRGWEVTGWFGDEGNLTPAEMTLFGANPNPFNPTTDIEFALPQAGEISLVIYDIRGREATRLLEGIMPAGRHSVTFNASSLPSGVYFAKLTAPGSTQTQKLLLVK